MKKIMCLYGQIFIHFTFDTHNFDDTTKNNLSHKDKRDKKYRLHLFFFLFLLCYNKRIFDELK